MRGMGRSRGLFTLNFASAAANRAQKEAPIAKLGASDFASRRVYTHLAGRELFSTVRVYKSKGRPSPREREKGKKEGDGERETEIESDSQNK